MSFRAAPAILLILAASCGGPGVESGRPPAPSTASEVFVRTTRDVFAAAQLALSSDDRNPTSDFSRSDRWSASLTLEQTTLRIEVAPEGLGSAVAVTASSSSVLGDAAKLQELATGTLDRVHEILFSGRLENPLPRPYPGRKATVTRNFGKDVPELFEVAKKSAVGIGYRTDKTSTNGTTGWWLRGRGPFGVHLDFIRRGDRTHVSVTAVAVSDPDPGMTEERIREQLKAVAGNLLDDIGKRAKDPGQP